ncbi:MAG: FKBP-type peptidyl-prolyl cis-trans isomerase [Tannerella sp.]|jgi:FKBP-type peptidyl-prolyl cis-trans isomerase FkpA/FKBP-type peptidyl-prolyl cis-trans isomerase FklB|nr:FKBP-type peptidyl-prolyl cis-trans isomerase [Tannerella sp.]
MKKFNLLAYVAIFAMVLTSVSCDSQKSVSLKTDVDSASFLIGSSWGKGLATQLKTLPGEPANIDAMIDGFAKAAKGDSVFLGMSDVDAQTYVNNYVQGAMTKASEVTLDEGRKFLEENKGKAGVITTETGLQYKVITEGTGEKPTSLEDTVLVHYTGKLLDGTVFDSSVDRGEPIKFALSQVIPGWSQGVLLMPKGSKYTMWIPSELAYGAQPAGQLIKANSTLEFEVELLDVIKKK